MLAEIGLFALILALGLSVMQAGVLTSGKLAIFFHPLLKPASSLVLLLVFCAFAGLMMLRIDSDFSVINVAEHSNRTLPLAYKIAGTWGNHEGSMLLWALVVTFFGALLSRKATLLNQYAMAVQALLAAGVLGFIIFTSNPFARLFPPAADGKMLNPLLQDIALVMHPPMLYLGYVGFSAVFSLAIAGLITRKIDRSWAEAAHPWIMFSWSALAIGIALGSWWAYRELGWGGFWFWDPVENASLLPWLAGTALLHSNIVLKKRGLLGSWVALLAILTFGLSLLGTFLVRSGAITSVHSFASDPARGFYILLYIILAIGGGLWLYAARIGQITESAPLRPASREGVIVLNNLFLLTACATVLLGTLYPMINEAVSGERITVGPPYFNLTFLPLMAVPLLFAGLAPFLPWKKAALKNAIERAWPSWLAASSMVIFALIVISKDTVMAAAGLGLSVFLLASSAQWIALGKWRAISNWTVFLGHVGVALLVLGITGVSLWSKQMESYVNPGDDIALAGYVVHVEDEEDIATPNYDGKRLLLTLFKKEKKITTLAPEFRSYGIRSTTTSEASIYTTPAYDIYAVAGESNDQGTALRLYFKPTISFLWGGALTMALGGIIAGLTTMRRKS